MKKGPDHSTAGAKESVQGFGSGIGMFMAFGLAGRHSGLMDGDDLSARLDKQIYDYVGWRDQAGTIDANFRGSSFTVNASSRRFRRLSDGKVVHLHASRYGS